jgi:CRP-like cAMP-binding protein
MEIKVLGCSGGRSPGLELSSYLVDDNLLLDTGGAVSSLSFDQQELITDVVITHAHLDHILGLAFLYDNTRLSRRHPLTVHATEPVLRNLREHLFTPGIMPGYRRGEADPESLHFHPIALEVPFRVGTVELEAFPVNHSSGAVALRISDLGLTCFYTGDTGPTDRIWEWMRKGGKTDCLLAEVSFPDRMADLAKISGHLTPASLIESLKKAELHPDHKVHLVHLKPAYMGELLDEIEAQRDWNLAVLRRGEVIRLERVAESKGLQEEIEERVHDKMVEFDRDSDLHEQRDLLTRDLGISAVAGDIVFRQGDKSKIMYIIQKGRVRIFSSFEGMEKTLALLGPGDFFGEMAMLNNCPRSATATALTDLKLLAFERPAFEKLVTENFGVALRVIRTLSYRLHEADSLIENLLYLDPASKVVNTLIRIAWDEAMESDEGLLIRTSPEELAEKSGVVIGTLRGILADLVRDNLIVAKREAIVIPDRKKLQRLLKFLELKNEFTA